MTDMTSIARPYAQAAYEFAREKKAVSNWLSMLLNLAEAVNNKDIQSLLDSPTYSQSQVAEVIISVLSDVLDEHAKNFIHTIAFYKRLMAVPWIYALFLQYKADDEQAKTAKITTAYEVPDDYIANLKQKLEKKFQCVINVKTDINESLVGGALIEIGDTVIDGSIKGKLTKLQHELQS